MISKTFFEQTCSSNFMFLPNEFGFTQQNLVSDRGLWIVRYTSFLLQIEVVFELLDQYIYVNIECFVNTEQQGLNYKERQANSFYLDSLLAIRAPNTSIFPPGVTGKMLNETEVSMILRNGASMLRKYAIDILQGDFQVLPQVKSYVQSVN